jgi:DNA-binding GntR family transcriptional regulator
LHLGIAEATANDYLFSAISAVYQAHIWTTAVGMGAEGGIPGSLTLAAEQHLAIVQAIRDGNPDAAAANMQKHIQMALESYQQEVRRRMSADLSPR